MEHVERIKSVIDSAYSGIVTDYHMVLGKDIGYALATWIPEELVEDAVCEIWNAHRHVQKMVERDISRTRKP